MDGGAPQGNPADAPPPLEFTPVDDWVYGEPDLVVTMEKGFTIPATGPDFTPSEIVDPKITEDRYVKWMQIIPTAHCCVHHSHVYAQTPEGADREGLGLGMGSNTDNEVDLIEYAAGNDADIFADGTAKLIKAGSKFRFSPHYHPYGEEAFDKQKVGIKFYPKGYKPEYVVTSHRIRTDVGNQWALNREKVEDVILRAGHKIDINEPRMPTGALVEENPLHAATMLSIPPNTVARHERFWPLPEPALIISFQPHMHFLGTRMMLEAIHPDGRREMLTDVPKLRAELADHLHLQDAASVPEGHHPAHHLVARQHGQQQEQPRSDVVARLGQPDDGRDGPRLDRHRVPDRRAVPGGTGEAGAGPRTHARRISSSST